MKKSPVLAVLITGLLAVSALFAYETGGFAYTKRAETNLLAEPKPLAKASGKLTYGKKVNIEQVQGAWLRVSDGPVSGWVFQGNLTAEKPSETEGLFDGAPLLASKTTATAAARPLDEAAANYTSDGQDFSSAKEDLEWLITSCAAITTADVEAYLKQNKRGEYQ